jgi:hypothetical protein
MAKTWAKTWALPDLVGSTDPDGHPWEVVVAPNIEVGEDRRVRLPD